MTHLTRRGRPLLRGLALALPATLLVALPAEAGSYGSTGAPDRELRAGCHDYRYHYRLDASMSEHDWMFETFLDDPTGETLGSGAFFSDWDPRRGRGTFRLCRSSTRPGQFTIRAKLTWRDGSESREVWLERSRFRLRRA